MKRIASIGLAALLGLSPMLSSPATASGLQLLTDIVIGRSDMPAFGGLSAIEMDRHGRGAVVVSDRATMFRIALSREAGRVTGLRITRTSPLTDALGNRPERPDEMDSEGLARLPDGRLALSFEGRMRLAIHGSSGRELHRIAPPPGSAAVPGNGAYEGLAADGRGRLYTLAERMPGRGPTPLYRYTGTGWEHFANLPRAGTYRPVGLDFDDRGRLYVLERRFSLAGFSSRITRYDLRPNGLGRGEVLLRDGRHGNLEGLSLWRHANGTLVASAVADNNFRHADGTRLVEYVVPD
jgi:hypothetical protein